MDIAAKAVHRPEFPGNLHQKFHGIVRIPNHGGTQEQALDVVTAVKLDGQLDKLFGGKGGPGNVVTPTVHAIGAVVLAGIAQQHFQQGDAPSVGGPSVANAGTAGIAKPTGRRTAARPARRTGHVVLGRRRKNPQFFANIHTCLFV